MMRKLFVWAMVATLLTAGSAFAVGTVRTAPNATAGQAFMTAAGPTTTNNDDSCDIGVTPAATLLLPYFEVDFNSSQATARTTLFTVTNVTNMPQIAHVTVWTDWSFPVLDFNLFLTGYDVQAINLYDILGPRATIAPPNGTSNQVDTGARSLPNDTGNPLFSPLAASSCAVLPGPIPSNILQDVRNGLTLGTYSSCGTVHIGGTHANAVGYITIDVARNCSTTLPTEPTYYSGDILFDNVLIGDYQDINPNPTTGNYAGGNPLVHIRAIPEGGPNGTGVSVPTNLPYTFYDRYTAGACQGCARTIDRRQPLPSTWAARYIQGGTGAFNTNYKIWREGVTGPNASCSAYALNNSTAMSVADIVRFDEHENPTTLAGGVVISPFPRTTVVLPETSSTPTSSGIFPVISPLAGDVAGWTYLNLNNNAQIGGAGALLASSPYSVTSNNQSFTTNPTGARIFSGNGTSTTAGGVRQNQDWVIVSMSAEGRYSVDFDAAWLGNGCSPAPPVSNAANPIGPLPNQTP
jgi:hypothetical protein